MIYLIPPGDEITGLKLAPRRRGLFWIRIGPIVVLARFIGRIFQPGEFIAGRFYLSITWIFP